MHVAEPRTAHRWLPSHSPGAHPAPDAFLEPTREGWKEPKDPLWGLRCPIWPPWLFQGPSGALLSCLLFPSCPPEGAVGQGWSPGVGEPSMWVSCPCWPQTSVTSAHPLPKPVFRSQPLILFLPPDSPDENASVEKEVFLGDNETANKISNARIGNDYFTDSDS